MSLRVGLGASQADIDVQGEIDFDFFEESDNSIPSAHGKQCSPVKAESNSISLNSSENQVKSNDLASSQNFNKPMITVSCDNATGAVQKTTIEATIPTPYNYKESKCGKVSSKSAARKTPSPRLQDKNVADDKMLDDRSISSMSDSESDLSSVSPDSFELEEESDSMTDVSPLASPYKCSTPAPDGDTANKIRVGEGVKFDKAEDKPCEKCGSIDIKELVSAMKRLKMKQNGNHFCALRCKSPIVTQNLKSRQNFTFTNEEVRRIDCDNRVLLKKIISQQNRSATCSSTGTPVRASSAVNRQKQDRQIQLENMAFLKRLETTKASRNLSRTHLLRDYEKRSGLHSRASSRSSYPSTSSRLSCRTSAQSSGRSSVSNNSSIASVNKLSP